MMLLKLSEVYLCVENIKKLFPFSNAFLFSITKGLFLVCMQFALIRLLWMIYHRVPSSLVVWEPGDHQHRILACFHPTCPLQWVWSDPWVNTKHQVWCRLGTCPQGRLLGCPSNQWVLEQCRCCKGQVQ